MRLDLFLKNSGLVKRRSIAKELCDGGKVTRNAKTAQPADAVKAGDILHLTYGVRQLELEILDVPRAPIAKAQRENYLRVLSETRLEDEF